jgi:hypothetical protein
MAPSAVLPAPPRARAHEEEAQRLPLTPSEVLAVERVAHQLDVTFFEALALLESAGCGRPAPPPRREIT